MICRAFRWRALPPVSWAILLGAFFAAFSTAAQTAAAPATAAAREAAEKAECTQHLKTLYAAVQAYQRDHKALPNWLSDLVPQYLEDANILTCPVALRTGETVARTQADPKLPSSYVYEFSVAPLYPPLTNAPDRTRREWRQRQMGLAGSIVPIIRCRHHKPVLNVAFDGTLYESPTAWELLVTNKVSLEDLKAAKIFASDTPSPAKAKPKTKAKAAKMIDARDPATPRELLDLTGFYNANLNNSWHGGSGDDLSALPKGVHTFDSVKFDVRGIVQLASKTRSATNFPAQVQGIKVNRKCERLHFLHAAGFGKIDPKNPIVGWYVLRFANDQMRLQIPIRYGHEVEDWHAQPDEGSLSSDLNVAWIGENSLSKRMTNSIRLFTTTWTNLAPNVEIESMDFVSAMGGPAPFLIAVTVD